MYKDVVEIIKTECWLLAWAQRHLDTCDVTAGGLTCGSVHRGRVLTDKSAGAAKSRVNRHVGNQQASAFIEARR